MEVVPKSHVRGHVNQHPPPQRSKYYYSGRASILGNREYTGNYVVFLADEDDPPSPREDEGDDSPTPSVDTNTAELEVFEELGKSRAGLVGGKTTTVSAPRRGSVTTKSSSSSTRKKDKKKRKDATEDIEERRNQRKRDFSELEDTVLNSEEFSADKKPDMFKDDRLFNRLPFKKATQICLDNEQLVKKKELKNKSKHAAEKGNEQLTPVKIREGKANAGDNLHEEARKLRPVNKEIKDMMKWIPAK